MQTYDFGIVEKILVVTMNWLGDVLFTTPAIRAIRKKFPNARIDVLAVPRVTGILEGNPDINTIIVNDESYIGRFRLVKKLRKEQYNVVFLMHRSKTRAMLCWLAGIPHRIGYNTKKRGRYLTASLEPPKEKVHMADYYQGILTGVGIDAMEKNYVLSINGNEKKWVERFFEDNGITSSTVKILLNPGGNWPYKKWDYNNYARLGDLLAENYNATVIITGAQKDIPLATKICQKMSADAVIAAGKTSLKTLAALISECDLYIGNDSGPTHIAHAVKTPLIVLFGPTDQDITGPFGTAPKKILQKEVGCIIPCYEEKCGDVRCMKSITVEEVYKAACEMLDASS